MASLTQKMIVEVFFQLLSKKNLDKITVKEIVDRCDINRNTFYYHYTDIYDLFDTLLCQGLSYTAERISSDDKREDTIKAVSAFLATHKKAIRNAYYSSGGTIMEERTSTFLDSFFLASAEHIIKNKGLKAYNDPAFAAAFFRNAVLGLMKDWLDDDKTPSPEHIFTSVGKYYSASLEAMLTADTDNKQAH